MTYYVSESASYRLTVNSQPTKYHKDPKCWCFKRGAKVIPLADQDRIAFHKYLKPCTVCMPGAVVPDQPRDETVSIKQNGPGVAAQFYPCPETITVWKCSDGRDFSDEKEALWYELDIMRQRMRRSTNDPTRLQDPLY